MPKRSAGLLLYRRGGAGIELLIVHPGGPFWARKDDGAWSVPKGEYTEEEDPERAAVREFEEELGRAAPEGPRLDLGVVTQAGGKRVHVFAVEGEFDVATTVSNTFEIEWPPRSGRTGVFPEVDRGAGSRPTKLAEGCCGAKCPWWIAFWRRWGPVRTTDRECGCGRSGRTVAVGPRKFSNIRGERCTHPWGADEERRAERGGGRSLTSYAPAHSCSAPAGCRWLPGRPRFRPTVRLPSQHLRPISRRPPPIPGQRRSRRRRA